MQRTADNGVSFPSENIKNRATARQEHILSGSRSGLSPLPVSESEWKQLLQYGRERALAAGIDAEDVPRLVEEHRSRGVARDADTAAGNGEPESRESA